LLLPQYNFEILWWGKQYLGQTDKSDHTSGGEKMTPPLSITVAKPETAERIQRLIDESKLN